MLDKEKMFGYYGIVVPGRQYHTSPACPLLRGTERWMEGEVNNYPKETDAIIAGHGKRCAFCFERHRFRIKVNETVHDYILDDYDLRVLCAMAKLYRLRKKITIFDIGVHAQMDIEKVNDTIKKLKKDKLVAGAAFLGNTVQRGRRKFTHMGLAVVTAYVKDLYDPPETSKPQPEFKLNRKLF